MASVKGPDFIALQVKNLEKSKDFYINHLGLNPAPASPPGAVLFDTAPIPFAVRVPLEGVNMETVSEPGLGIALWLLCSDSRELHSQLVSAGVEVMGEPQPGPFGLTFQFKDPDEYLLTVHDKG